MAKRAIRRLVRLPNGTVGIKYIDLNTFQEVLDLTGYQVLDTGQTEPEPELNDNSDDKEVAINPPSGGSTAGKGSRGEKGTNTYISGSKNPQIAKYLDSQTPVKAAAVDPASGIPADDDVGGVTVTSDEDIANAEWADVEGPGDIVTDSAGQQFGGLNQTEFDENIQDWAAGVKVEKDLQTADFKEQSASQKKNEANIRTNMPSVGLYTAAQKNIDQGLAPGFVNTVRPDVVAKNANTKPAQTVRPEVVGNNTAKSVINGVRPEVVSDNSSKAKPGAVTDPASRAAINAGIAGLDNSLVSPADTAGAYQGAYGIAGTPRASQNTVRPEVPGSLPAASPVSNTVRPDVVGGNTGNLAQADPTRYDNPMNNQIATAAKEVNRVSQMEMAPSVPTTDRPVQGVRPQGGIVAGMPGAKPAAKSTGMPASTGVAGGTVAPGFGVFSKPQDAAKPSVAKSINQAAANVTDPSKFAGEDLSRMSPARAATLGLVDRTPAQKAAIGKMMAGELHPNTMANLYSADEAKRNVARQEFANVATTVENRAQSSMFGSLENTLDPGQYNSLMTDSLPNGTVPMDNTNANYTKYSKSINTALDAYYAGTYAPTNYDLTSYYNAAEVTPSWGPKMANTQKVGYHTFGTLPEYAPGEAFQTERSRLAAAKTSETRGFTPSASMMGRPSAHSVERERDTSLSGSGSGFGAGGSRGTSGIGRSDSAGAGRGSSMGGPGLGSSNSGGSGGTGRSSAGAGRGSSMGGPGIGSSAGAGPGRGSSPGGPSGKGASSSGSGIGGGANTNGQGSASKGSVGRSEGDY